MKYKDYYKIMGVDRSAKAEEIKKAYRKLARKYHPDVSKEKDAEEKFKELQEAYAVLKDQEKRAAYDQLGSRAQGEEFTPPPGWQSGFSDFSTSNFAGDGVEQFSDFFADLFGGGFARGNRTRAQDFAVAGQDIRSKLIISLEDAFHGAVLPIQLQIPGYDASGRLIHEKRALKVKIPEGVVNGQQIRLANQGGKGTPKAPCGDLYLEIEIKPHSMFKVHDRDLFLKLPITPWEAALGSKVTIPTMSGRVTLQIPAESESGKKLRLKGKGLSSKNKSGDQYVTLEIVTPIPKTKEQCDFYKMMAETMPFNPRKNLGV